jgi:hypothetical protein
MRGGPTIATLSLLHAANTRKLFYTATVRAATLARNVRFGSKADMCAAKSDVRFAPNSDRESGHAGRRAAPGFFHAQHGIKPQRGQGKHNADSGGYPLVFCR